MNTLVALALLAQIAGIFCQGYPDYYQYHVPRPSIKAWNPVGFRLSIPHRPGIEKVTYHVSLTGPIASPDAGELTQQLDDRDRWNYRWTFIDRKTQLQGGDKVFFWVEVVKDGKTYTYDNGRFIVTEKFFSSEESDESVSSEELRYYRNRGYSMDRNRGYY